MAVIASLNVLLKGDATLYSTSMKRAGSDATALDTVVGRLGNGVSKLNSVMKAAGVAGAAAAAVGFVKFASSIADAVENTDMFAKRIGTSYNELLALRTAADRNGSSAETMDAALQRMTNTIGEAGMGSASAAESLMRLNLTFGILSQLKPDRQFLMIANSISQIQSPMERVAAVQDIFGKSAAEMGNLLTMTQGDLLGYQNAVRASGRALSDSQIQDLSKMKDSVEELSSAWDGLKLSISSAAAPALTGTLKDISRVINHAREQSSMPAETAQQALDRRYQEEQAFRQSHMRLPTGQLVQLPEFATPADTRAPITGESNKFFGFDMVEKAAKSLAPSLESLRKAVDKAATAAAAGTVVDNAKRVAGNWMDVFNGFAANAVDVYTKEKARQDEIGRMLPGSFGVGSQEGLRLIAQRNQQPLQNPAVKAATKANNLLQSILNAVSNPKLVQFNL